MIFPSMTLAEYFSNILMHCYSLRGQGLVLHRKVPEFLFPGRVVIQAPARGIFFLKSQFPSEQNSVLSQP